MTTHILALFTTFAFSWGAFRMAEVPKTDDRQINHDGEIEHRENVRGETD